MMVRTSIGQVEYYRSEGHPENWGLFASGAITRRHNEKTKLMGELWWHENRTKTFQDQLSLPVVVRSCEQENGLKYNVCGVGTPWRTWWNIDEH